MGVSRRECARIIGVSEAAIRKALKAGRINAEPDGTLDPNTVREAWEKATDPARTAVRSSTQGAHAPVPAAIQSQAKAEAELATTRVREILKAEGVVVEGELTFNQARTAEKVVQTWQRDQAYAREAGRLILAEEAERLWSDEVVQMRARLLAIPGECAFELSHLSKHDLSIIDRIVRDAMTDTAGVHPS